MDLNLNLTMEKELVVRTLQMQAQYLSKDMAIELLCELIRQMAVKDQVITALLKDKLSKECNENN